MDDKNVNWSQDRYNEISKEVLKSNSDICWKNRNKSVKLKFIPGQLDGYLKKIGYNPEKIPKIPISGWTGDNLFEQVHHPLLLPSLLTIRGAINGAHS